jgi:23S rRNA (adenine2030-N6)-methyltransferase
MGYSNYGQIGDVWKHLPLLDILSIEKPEVYYETNAGYSNYQVETATEKQRFGTGMVLSVKRNEESFPFLSNSYYIQNLPKNIESPFTLYGSPSLAHKILENESNYILCDLDQEAIASHKDYFSSQSAKLELINQESIEYTWNWLNNPNPNTFMVVDPYEINEPNSNGHTFFDVFKKSAERGVRTFLWYHFQYSTMMDGVQNLINSLDISTLNLQTITFHWVS